MKKKIKILFFLNVVIFGLIAWNSAGATTISPTKIEATLGAGRLNRYSMTLYNETADNLYLDGSVELFKPKGDEGQAELIPGDTDKTLSWLKLPQPSLVIKPGEYKNVPLVIEVPKNTAPGGHYFAVMWKSGSGPDNPKSQIGISSRVGCLVLLDVKGESNDKLQIIDFKLDQGNGIYDGLPVAFVSHLRNDGNTHLNPKGSIILENLLGQVVDTVPYNAKKFNILPQSVRKFDSIWLPKKNSFIIGRFSAKLVVEYGDARIRTESNKIYFWIIPWKLATGAIIIIIILIILTYMLKRKKKLIS